MTQPAPKIALPGIPQTGKFIRSHRCEVCKYAEKENPAHPHYSCHRNPPVASILPSNKGPQTLSAFPIVRPEQWCGAFEPKISQVN
jgi:hypothetical protein